MSCHENNNSNKHKGFKHILHMILCCGPPILIIGMLPFIKSFSPSLASELALIAPFICPIMMIIMVIIMFKKRDSSCCESKSSNHN